MGVMSDPHESARLPVQGFTRLSPGLAESSQHIFSQDANAYLQSVAVGDATQASSTTTASSSSPHRIRRRNRMITSCLECRRRKLKCDKLHPCTNCAKFVRDCVFLAPALDSASQLKLTEIKEKMGVLERGLEVEIAKAKKQEQLNRNGAPARAENEGASSHFKHVRTGSIDLPGELSHEKSEEDEALEVPEDEKDLEPTPLAVVDAAYDDDADDDMLDLGVKMGKMRYDGVGIRWQREC
jgi:Fungal Zn(2)-Cys(6) binuclear cluster domain